MKGSIALINVWKLRYWPKQCNIQWLIKLEFAVSRIELLVYNFIFVREYKSAVQADNSLLYALGDSMIDAGRHENTLEL